MVNHAEIRNEDGSITVKLRNESGELNLKKVRELITEHPGIFSPEDTTNILSEVVERSLSLEKNLGKLQKRVAFMEDEKARRAKKSLYGEMRIAKKDLELLRAIGNKRQRKNARDTIRRDVELLEEEEDEEKDSRESRADIGIEIVAIGNAS